MTTNELNLHAWCSQRATNFRNYEQHEMAMYPSADQRDEAIVEWTVRVLGNPLTSGAREALELIARQHGLELADAGTTAALTESRTQAANRGDEVGRLVDENARLRAALAKVEEIGKALDQTDEKNAQANRLNEQYHGYGARLLYAVGKVASKAEAGR